jgi:hypothetical protein
MSILENKEIIEGLKESVIRYGIITAVQNNLILCNWTDVNS